VSLEEYLISAPAEKRPQLRQQHQDAVTYHRITCGCGLPRALNLAYKCLYCGEWFCFSCAETHFGTTYREWITAKRAPCAEQLKKMTEAQLLAHIKARRARA
jgi:hypothetical protein